MEYYLGIDIGGTKCAVIAGTHQMKILDRVQFATETNNGPDYAINKLCSTMDQVIAGLGRKPVAIGISCGGPLNSKLGIVQSPPNLPGWDNVPIVSIFKDKFRIPVYLQNDANACALAEWRFGAGQGTKNMVFLTFGTGMGAGLIIDGRLYTGTNDMAGEVGHIRLDENGPIGFGKHGSFEGFCSGGGIAQLGQSMVREKLMLGGSVEFLEGKLQVDELTTKDLAEAANSGDVTALEVFKRSGHYLGIGLSILIDILNPERIVIGSVYARNPQLFNEACRDILEKEALKPALEVCEIVPAGLGDEVGDLASLSVAMT